MMHGHTYIKYHLLSITLHVRFTHLISYAINFGDISVTVNAETDPVTMTCSQVEFRAGAANIFNKQSRRFDDGMILYLGAERGAMNE
jgi:hypothetical protein